jgi:predicted DNA-binding ribbon-helix-helix protein
MKSPVVKRSIVVAGHKTSVSLEEAFWNGMKEISSLRDMTLSELRDRQEPRAGQPLVRAPAFRAGLFPFARDRNGGCQAAGLKRYGSD